eukprot:CAMPEP_0198269872 /NCGR_PEP_ID=MMETSP1447-20131203/42979_1 /TAXON_ID=420782 /ORGANISM="Chaetoceros dichaeta, Strain CCMP1751" /LENGTH=71 /DNA_ID=CAMNT_0043961643 /DNA_START=1 /DNA_END=216 /DNA_ORIENTATION=+
MQLVGALVVVNRHQDLQRSLMVSSVANQEGSVVLQNLDHREGASVADGIEKVAVLKMQVFLPSSNFETQGS